MNAPKEIRVMATGVGLYDNHIYNPGDIFNMRASVFNAKREPDKDGKADPNGRVIPPSWVCEVEEKEARKTEYVPKGKQEDVSTLV